MANKAVTEPTRCRTRRCKATAAASTGPGVTKAAGATEAASVTKTGSAGVTHSAGVGHCAAAAAARRRHGVAGHCGGAERDRRSNREHCLTHARPPLDGTCASSKLKRLFG
jgi:hypothetical protein